MHNPRKMPGIPEETLGKFKTSFQADAKNQLAQNICTQHDLLKCMTRRSLVESTNHVYTHRVESEAKPVTDQKSSGRCWIFALLNVVRMPVMKQLNIDDFEFSQNYVFFWDKLERIHFQLRNFITAAKKQEPADGRLMSHLLHNPAEDGGQWDMLVNIVEKYGLVPKKCFPETQSATASRRMNLIINNKLREFAGKLRKEVAAGNSDEELDNTVEGMMEQFYRLVSICLGTPPATFTWEYYSKGKEYQKIGPISPLEFYKQHVKPVFNMEDKVCLVNDPRAENSYDNLYTVDYLGNMVGGRPVLYINQPVSVLKKLAADSIKGNESVWFGCDVGKHCSWKDHGIEDLELHDYELVFGLSVLNMDKATRLVYGESMMTHAMVLTAVSEKDSKYTKWRIENSWGSDGGDKGYLTMTDDWFSEFVYEVVVDKKFVPQEIQDVLKKDPVVLPAWDPMGTLAH